MGAGALGGRADLRGRCRRGTEIETGGHDKRCAANISSFRSLDLARPYFENTSNGGRVWSDTTSRALHYLVEVRAYKLLPDIGCRLTEI